VLISGTFRNYFYLVNRNNGLIIQSCYLPAGEGNDSQTYARLPGLPAPGNTSSRQWRVHADRSAAGDRYSRLSQRAAGYTGDLVLEGARYDRD